ncbi:MAG: 50S ribosomal protein L7/L12 [Clostridia bacterium]|nr:50S ribosomal protein L7/L12 [Clostridia bacterium]
MAKINDILEEIKKLTVVEVSDLVKLLEEEFGVSAAAPVAVAAAPVAGAAAGAAPAAGGAEEKATYNVVLKGVADGGNKIKVIRAVKEAANLGLTEAKDMVENAPKTIKENVSPDEAKELAEKLKAEGAIVELA